MPYRVVYTEELYHHGIKGQRWGVRRYQNYDGSLTAKGRSYYGDGGPVKVRGAYKTAEEKTTGKVNGKVHEASPAESSGSSSKKGLSKGAKTAIIAGSAVAAVAVGAITVRKLNEGRYATMDALKKFNEEKTNINRRLTEEILEPGMARIKKEADARDYSNDSDYVREVNSIKNNSLLSDDEKKKYSDRQLNNAKQRYIDEEYRAVRNEKENKMWNEEMPKLLAQVRKDIPYTRKMNDGELYMFLSKSANNPELIKIGDYGKDKINQAQEALKDVLMKDILKFR